MSTFLLGTLLLLAGSAPAPTAPPWPTWLPRGAALPPPTGTVIEVGDVPALFEAVARATPGTTILVAPGRYSLPRRLDLKTHQVTLRGKTGKAEDAILDGAEHGLGELVAVTASRDVTIADITIEHARWNGFKIDSETGVQRLAILNCNIHDVWQRGVKGVKVPAEGRESLRPSGCRVEGCLFYNDRPKRFEDDPADTPDGFGGNYIGGIDVMYAKGWTIRGNAFVGIRGRTGEGRGAIFIWHESEDCLVERNVIVDCDSGICLGNSHKPPDVRTHAIRCTVRNNFIARAPENGILADFTEDCRIFHNTVSDPKSRMRRLVRVVHDNPGLRVVNNLLDGPFSGLESPGTTEVRGLVAKDLTGAFVDAARGDLHLKPGAKDDKELLAGSRLPEVDQDIDGDPRGDSPQLGADEIHQ